MRIILAAFGGLLLLAFIRFISGVLFQDWWKNRAKWAKGETWQPSKLAMIIWIGLALAVVATVILKSLR